MSGWILMMLQVFFFFSSSRYISTAAEGAAALKMNFSSEENQVKSPQFKLLLGACQEFLGGQRICGCV